MVRFRHPRRLLVGAATLLATLVSAALLPHVAHAMISSCRTDPIIVLSDGTALDITATINTTASNVVSVAYTVHTPQDLSVAQVTYTGGSLSNKESLTVDADQNPGVYVTTTYATTSSTATMTTTSTLVQVSSASVTSKSASGHTAQNLTITF